MAAYDMLAKAYDKLMYDAEYDKWAQYINSFLNSKNAVIYEAACGTGSISCRLEKTGHKVIASDISQAMLVKAAAKARQLGCDIIFIQQDMRDINVVNRVDAVVCACDGPNYIDTNGLRMFAKSAFSALKEGGVLLFDISTRAKLSSMDKQVYFDENDDITCIWQSEYEHSLHKLNIDVILFMREGRLYNKYCETHVQYAHDLQKVKNILKSTGFKTTDAFEFMTASPCVKGTQRAQFVCRK